MESLSERMRGSTAAPDSPGIRTSRSATSTRRDRTMSSAVPPSGASRTSKSFCKIARSDSRTPTSSSMTRTTGRGRYAGDPASPCAAPLPLVGDGKDDIFVPASAALEIDGHRITGLCRGDRTAKALDVSDRLSIHFDDRVAWMNARLIARAPRRHVGHEYPRLGRQFESLGGFGRERFDAEAQRLLFR